MEWVCRASMDMSTTGKTTVVEAQLQKAYTQRSSVISTVRELVSSHQVVSQQVEDMLVQDGEIVKYFRI